TITVTGAGGGGGGVPSAPANPFFSLNFPNLNNFIPPLGERLVPTVQSLSRLTWKPLPFPVAYPQFRPSQPYAFRLHNFFDPIDAEFNQSRHRDRGSRTATLGKRVFTRGRFHDGQPDRWEHPVPVIPTYLQV